MVVIGSWLMLLVGGSVVLGIGGWTGEDVPMSAQFLATVPFWLAAVGGVVWLSRRDPAPAVALGLSARPIDVPLGIVAGVGAQLLILPAIYWPILRLFGEDYGAVEREARRLAASATGTVQTVLFVLMASLIAPVVEELLYRGLMLRSSGWSSRVALVVTAVVFGLAHVQGLQLPGLIVFGLIAGILAQRTGRLTPAVVAHVAFNTTSVIQLLARR